MTHDCYIFGVPIWTIQTDLSQPFPDRLSNGSRDGRHRRYKKTPRMVTSKAAATIHTMTMILSENMDVSKNRGKTPKWMVKIMENPIEIG